MSNNSKNSFAKGLFVTATIGALAYLGKKVFIDGSKSQSKLSELESKLEDLSRDLKDSNLKNSELSETLSSQEKRYSKQVKDLKTSLNNDLENKTREVNKVADNVNNLVERFNGWFDEADNDLEKLEESESTVIETEVTTKSGTAEVITEVISESPKAN